jgi:1-acyl-sn-glycerol-3-phosphate acyltransferase
MLDIYIYIYNLFNMLKFITKFILITIFIPILLLIIRPIYSVFNIKIDWDLNAYIFIYMLLGVKSTITNDEKLIEKGFILSNHRTWFDFGYDPYIAKGAILGRKIAFYAVSFFSILGYLDNKILMFSRNRVNRSQIYNLMADFIKNGYTNRVVFYPEGTRQDYLTLKDKSDILSKLKKGLLKEIYERKEYAVQLLISSNKDVVFNEKKIITNYGTNVNTCISRSIHPVNFNTFDDFLNEICIIWFDCWERTHRIV